MKENTSKADTITAMNTAIAYDSLTDDEKNSIQYIAYSGGTVYVPNTDTRLTVKKIWIDSNGNEFTGSGTVPITVTLYQQSFNDDNTAASDKTIAKDTDGKDIKVTLSDANNWQYTWNSLPQTDSNNKKILYSVVEDPVSDYSVSYSVSEIQTGMITITNKSSFSLPSTGGIGNTPYYLVGIMLMAVSLIFYLRKKTGSGGCG
jgi:LPXTG-motif cell wall-anchored protein